MTLNQDMEYSLPDEAETQAPSPPHRDLVGDARERHSRDNNTIQSQALFGDFSFFRC